MTVNKMMGPLIDMDRDGVDACLERGQALSERSNWRDWSFSPGKGEPADNTATITAERLSQEPETVHWFSEASGDKGDPGTGRSFGSRQGAL